MRARASEEKFRLKKKNTSCLLIILACCSPFWPTYRNKCMKKELEGGEGRWRLNSWGLLKFHILPLTKFGVENSIVHFYLSSVCSIISSVIGICRSDEWHKFLWSEFLKYIIPYFLVKVNGMITKERERKDYTPGIETMPFCLGVWYSAKLVSGGLRVVPFLVSVDPPFFLSYQVLQNSLRIFIFPFLFIFSSLRVWISNWELAP